MRLGTRLRCRVAALLAAIMVAAAPAVAAQETVADIQAELRTLDGQIQQIRDALVETGPASGLPRDAGTAFQRLDQLDATLRRLTDRVDVLTNDLTRIVEDASNRVGDIEFRLTELEGGDTSLIGEPAPLGGGITQPRPRPTAPGAEAIALPAPPFALPDAPLPPAAGAGVPQLAVGEQADFDAAKTAVEDGNYAAAAGMLDRHLETYPGGPLAGEAQLLKGEALAGQGDWQGAARSYLDAFSGAPDAATAPRALYRLAVSLGRLGQTDEACLTLTEVEIRYPGSPVTAELAEERGALRCP